MSDKKMLYAVGEYIRKTDDGAVWDFCGVFEKQEDAEKACIGDSYFVGPIPSLNKAFPANREPWPGVYYPNRETRP
jgi:hypothetical protein